MSEMARRLVDGFGRAISYLRVSVTDRCDLRCFYCLAPSYRGFESRDHWLQPDELERVVRIFAGLGVRHVRLTGGEPLVRRELPDIARRLGAVRGIEDLSLSTNGTRLEHLAGMLRAAGVRRINLSLDSLKEDTFRRITGGELAPVLRGLEAADVAGLDPVKINCVVMRGINDGEVESLTEFCLRRGYTLRFIETMPVGAGGREASAHFVDLQDVRERLDRGFGLSPAALRGSGPASYWQVAGTELVVGFITPQSRHFCATCNRVRLAAEGTLHLCLGQEDKVALRPLLRAGLSDADLAQVIGQAVLHKPERHEFVDRPGQILRPMSALGG